MSASKRVSAYACICVSEKGFCIRGDLCEFDHGVDPVVIDNVLPGQPFPARQSPLTAVAAAAPVTRTPSGSVSVTLI